MQCHRVTFCTDLFLPVFFFFFEWTFVLCSAHGVCLIWSCIPQPLVYSHAVFAFASHGELQILVSPYDTMSKMIPKSSLHNSISRMGHLTILCGKFLRSILCLQKISVVWIVIY